VNRRAAGLRTLTSAPAFLTLGWGMPGRFALSALSPEWGTR
jgi:hypothetical protein